MNPSGRLRRTVALASVGGLASALTWLPAGPASAVTPTAEYVAQGSSSAASGCSVTSGSSFDSNPVLLTNGKAQGSASLNTTWTNGGNPSDVTTVSASYSGKTHLVRSGGVFKSSTLSGSGHISINAALGGSSTCDVSVQMINALVMTTTQPAGWYYVTRSTGKGSLAEAAIVRGSLSTLTKPVLFEAYQGGPNSATQRAFVKAGQYSAVFAAGIEGGDFPLLTGKSVNTNSMTAFFRNAGSAFAGTSGSGAKFVTFPASISCSHHTAKLTWRSAASKLASGTFSVNGSKKATVNNPKPGSGVVLHNLSSTADNKITAKLSLKGGGKASVSRLYVPCKG